MKKNPFRLRSRSSKQQLCNNEGSLVFSYNLEDIDHTSGGADIFNGQQSVLWKLLREMFPDELKAMYRSLRSEGKLSYADTERRFEEHQAKWSEAIFNEDAYFKYLAPAVGYCLVVGYGI